MARPERYRGQIIVKRGFPLPPSLELPHHPPAGGRCRMSRGAAADTPVRVIAAVQTPAARLKGCRPRLAGWSPTSEVTPQGV